MIFSNKLMVTFGGCNFSRMPIVPIYSVYVLLVGAIGQIEHISGIRIRRKHTTPIVTHLKLKDAKKQQSPTHP